MNPICGYCAHQQTNAVWEGTTRCGRAQYHSNGGYGQFKGGASCKYDSDLEDNFEPVDGAHQALAQAARLNARTLEDLGSLRYENALLKERLTKV